MSSLKANAKFGFLFAILAVALSVVSVFGRQYALMVGWPVVTCSILSLGYLGFVHNVFGKKPDGTLPLINILCLLPYLTIYHGVWHARRWMGHNPGCDEIRPGLFISRRLYGHELPENVDLIIDLTSEFVEPEPLRMAADYVCVPVLDGGAISLKAIVGAVHRITEHKGTALVHCAEGNGRSVMIAAAVLLFEGEAQSVSNAVELIQVNRPAARLRPPQQRVLETLLAALRDKHSLPPHGSRFCEIR